MLMATGLTGLLRSRWQNSAIVVGMVMVMAGSTLFSVALPRAIRSDSWRLVVSGSCIAFSVLLFGWLAIRAWRIGLYANRPGQLIVRTLTRTRTLPVEAVERVAVYHGHSAHGGRFY